MHSIDNSIIAYYESVEVALEEYLKNLNGKTTEPEEIDVENSNGRILYEDIIAQYDLPLFNRALDDGYAINSHDIALADETNPTELELIGEINVGDVNQASISKNQAIKISRGAMMPENADSVVPSEHTITESNKIKVLKSTTIGENVALKGEDIKAGEIFIERNRKIRPLDISGIISLGCKKVIVYKKPVVSVIPTGNELVPLHTQPLPGQQHETNSVVLKGFMEQLGASCIIKSIVKDDLDAIREAIQYALKTSDLVIVCGGSSIGSKDYTLEAIKHIENSKIVTHGIAMRPGRQTLLAFVGDKPVIGLPGHPVSSVTAFWVFVKPVIKQMACNPSSVWQESKENIKISAILARDVESPNGSEDYVRVRLNQLDNGKITAYPYAGKASFISTLVKAHGIIKIAPDCTKLYEGDRVEVLLF